MTVAKNPVQLSRRQLEYLRGSSFLAKPLMEIVRGVATEGDEPCTIQVSHEMAEQFRTAFTEELARVGFDADYEPNHEGRILEELIDRFFSKDGG